MVVFAADSAEIQIDENHSIVSEQDLLKAHRFQDLDAVISKSLQEYHQGKISDIDLWRVFSPFDIGSSAMDIELDAWVAASPKSPSALTARAIHLTAEGIVESMKYQLAPSESRNRVVHAFRAAQSDFVKSLQLDPALIVSYAGLINVEQTLSPPSPYWEGFRSIIAMKTGFRIPPLSRERHLLDKANSVAPHNYIARAAYIRTIRGLWGAESDRNGPGMIEINWFLDECKAAALPAIQLQALRAEVALTPFVRADSPSAAATLTVVRPVETLVDQRERAVLLTRVAAEVSGYGQTDLALHYVDEAIAVRPDTVRALGMRAWYLHEKNDPRAVIALIHAADAGDAWSEYLYGSFLIAGTGVPKDERLGNRLQREATAMGFQPGE